MNPTVSFEFYEAQPLQVHLARKKNKKTILLEVKRTGLAISFFFTVRI